VVVPHDPDSPASVAFSRAAQAVAPSLGVQVTAAGVHDLAEFERTITVFAGEAYGGLIVVPQSIVPGNRDFIIELAVSLLFWTPPNEFFHIQAYFTDFDCWLCYFRYFIACCTSGPLKKPIPSISVLASASCPSCTPGARH
jgi:hypothetical protein